MSISLLTLKSHNLFLRFKFFFFLFCLYGFSGKQALKNISESDHPGYIL